jgi:hypothetical protein
MVKIKTLTAAKGLENIGPKAFLNESKTNNDALHWFL